jgi:hypothetical protein
MSSRRTAGLRHSTKSLAAADGHFASSFEPINRLTQTARHLWHKLLRSAHDRLRMFLCKITKPRATRNASEKTVGRMTAVRGTEVAVAGVGKVAEGTSPTRDKEGLDPEE